MWFEYNLDSTGCLVFWDIKVGLKIHLLLAKIEYIACCACSFRVMPETECLAALIIEANYIKIGPAQKGPVSPS